MKHLFVSLTLAGSLTLTSLSGAAPRPRPLPKAPALSTIESFCLEMGRTIRNQALMRDQGTSYVEALAFHRRLLQRYNLPPAIADAVLKTLRTVYEYPVLTPTQAQQSFEVGCTGLQTTTPTTRY